MERIMYSELVCELATRIGGVKLHPSERDSGVIKSSRLAKVYETRPRTVQDFVDALNERFTSKTFVTVPEETGHTPVDAEIDYVESGDANLDDAMPGKGDKDQSLTHSDNLCTAIERVAASLSITRDATQKFNELLEYLWSLRQRPRIDGGLHILIDEGAQISAAGDNLGVTLRVDIEKLTLLAGCYVVMGLGESGKSRFGRSLPFLLVDGEGRPYAETHKCFHTYIHEEDPNGILMPFIPATFTKVLLEAYTSGSKVIVIDSARRAKGIFTSTDQSAEKFGETLSNADFITCLCMLGKILNVAIFIVTNPGSNTSPDAYSGYVNVMRTNATGTINLSGERGNIEVSGRHLGKSTARELSHITENFNTVVKLGDQILERQIGAIRNKVEDVTSDQTKGGRNDSTTEIARDDISEVKVFFPKGGER